MKLQWFSFQAWLFLSLAEALEGLEVNPLLSFAAQKAVRLSVLNTGKACFCVIPAH